MKMLLLFHQVAKFGRRKGLKIPREQSHAGSSPALGITIRIIRHFSSQQMQSQAVRIPKQYPASIYRAAYPPPGKR